MLFLNLHRIVIPRYWLPYCYISCIVFYSSFLGGIVVFRNIRFIITGKHSGCANRICVHVPHQSTQFSNDCSSSIYYVSCTGACLCMMHCNRRHCKTNFLVHSWCIVNKSLFYLKLIQPDTMRKYCTRFLACSSISK